ncbi:MAG: O-antigen ligase family protein [Armatimonadota bacterium]
MRNVNGTFSAGGKWGRGPLQPGRVNPPFGNIAQSASVVARVLLFAVIWLLLIALYLASQVGIAYITTETPALFGVLLGIVLLGVVLLLASREKRWRLLLFVGFYIIMSGQLGLFFGSTKLSTFVMEALLSLGLVAFVLLDSLTHRRNIWPPGLVVLLLFLHLFFVVLSVWNQDTLSDHRVTRNILIQYALGIGLFIGGYLYLRRWSQVGTYLQLMLGGATIFALLGIAEYLLGETFYNYYLRVFPGVLKRVQLALVEHRIFGPFDNPVLFGAWLAMFAPLAMYWLLQASTFWGKIWSRVVFGILFLALFFTGSRAPFVAAVVAVVLVPWVTCRPRLARLLTSLAIIAAVLLGSVGPFVARLLPENNLLLRIVDPASARFTGTTTLSTLQDTRAEAWRQAVQEWARHPLLGIGPGEWVEQRRRATNEETLRLVSAYSPYLLALVETGTLGAGALFLVLLVILRLNWVTIRSLPPGPERDLVGALSISCLVVHLVSITDVGFSLNRLYYFFWLTQGILLKAPYVAEVQPEKTSVSHVTAPQPARLRSVPAAAIGPRRF